MQVTENPAQKTVLLVFTGLLITCYLVANIMSVRIIDFFGILSFDAGTLTFPLTYIIGDVVTEIFGYKNTRKIIFTAFFCQLLFVGFVLLGLCFDEIADPQIDASYQMIFTYVPRIICASLISFLIGELLNAKTFVWIKKITNGKLLFVRTIGSSIFGYLLDSILFATLAFAGTVSFKVLIDIMVANFLLKMGVEIIIGTPCAYILVHFLKKKFGESS